MWKEFQRHHLLMRKMFIINIRRKNMISMLVSNSLVFLTVYKSAILAREECSYLASFLKWQDQCCTLLNTDGRTVRWHDTLPEPLLVPEQIVEPMAGSFSNALKGIKNQILIKNNRFVLYKSALCYHSRNLIIRWERHPPERFMWLSLIGHFVST